MVKTLTRLAAVFLVAFVNALTVGAFIDLASWKAAVLAGAFSVVEILRSLAASYTDGILTQEEIDAAFGNKI